MEKKRMEVKKVADTEAQAFFPQKMPPLPPKRAYVARYHNELLAEDFGTPFRPSKQVPIEGGRVDGTPMAKPLFAQRYYADCRLLTVPMTTKIRKKRAEALKAVQSFPRKPPLKMKTVYSTLDSVRGSISDSTCTTHSFSLSSTHSHSRRVCTLTTARLEPESASGCELVTRPLVGGKKSATNGMAIDKHLLEMVQLMAPTLATAKAIQRKLLLEMDDIQLLDLMSDLKLFRPKIDEVRMELLCGNAQCQFPTPLISKKSLAFYFAAGWSKRTSNCDSITLAFSAHKNSLFSCISHACAGLSYAKVAFLAVRSLKFSTPASDLRVGTELSRVQLASEYRFELVSLRTAKGKTKSALRPLSERICAQIDKDQCVISNDDSGHFSLLCGYKREITDGFLRTYFLMRYFGKTPKHAAMCYASVAMSTRKLVIFVGKDKTHCAVKPLTLFYLWAKDAVRTNRFFLDVAYAREKVKSDLLEGVGGFHRLMQRVESEETPLELSRAIRCLMGFFDARVHTLHWTVCHLPLWTLSLQQSIQPLLTVWRGQLELVTQTVGDFSTFDGSSQSLEVGCDARTRRRLLQILRQLSAIEVDAMDHLEAVLRTDDVWLL